MIPPSFSEIPELQASQRLVDIPPRLQAALDARAAEKVLLSQWVENWLQALRPEMERMTREILEHAVEDFWRRHPPRKPNASNH